MSQSTDTSSAPTPDQPDPGHYAGIPAISVNQLAPIVRQRLQPKIDRLGYLGGFFQLTAHQPEALAAFIDFTESSKAALPDDLAEIVALTVATHTGNDYERHQHERLAVKLGHTRGWVASVERLHPDAEYLTTQQLVTQRWVIAALKDHGHGCAPELHRLVAELGPKIAVAVALLCGRYIAHATIVNSFAINPPVGSIFDAPQGS